MCTKYLLEKASEMSENTSPTLLPRINIQAFCESNELSQTINEASADRRMIRVHLSVHMGGVGAAIAYYGERPTPDVLVVETDLSDDTQLLSILQRLSLVCRTETKVVVIGKRNDVALYRMLVSHGVSEYVVAPLDGIQLISVIAALFEAPDSKPRGRLCVFYGLRGGCGSSTISHNVSWHVAKQSDKDTLIVDMDMAFGTLALNYDKDTAKNIIDAIENLQTLDELYLERLLIKIENKLSILPAPCDLISGDFPPASSYDHLFDILSQLGATVIADLPHIWDEVTRNLLAGADEIILTALPDLASLRNTRNLLRFFSSIRANDKPPYLILNQINMPKRPEISRADFEKAINRKIDFTIPFDSSLFSEALNKGVMIAEISERESATHTFSEIAKEISSERPSEKSVKISSKTEKKKDGFMKFWS